MNKDHFSYNFKCNVCKSSFVSDKSLTICPLCKSKDIFKNVNVVLNCEFKLCCKIEYSGKSLLKVGKRKRPSFEFGYSEALDYNGEPVSLDFYRDRSNDSYVKTLTYLKTGKKVLIRNKKLSSHIGFGSARIIKPNK